ncbi:disease resistance protein RPH8A-like [Salvia hispanica]|uniref:disease resistance protein RPH8A-like n=1 Tax=Salvia hispanica TaxID=49212 RepID=UPI0020091C20|nr:disease resistance protein RPH8A-like [Salvia hispanica]
MTRVRKLDIEHMEKNSDVKKMMATLSDLENLDFLILRGFRFRSMPSLDGFGILHNLTRLKLEGLLTRLPDANSFPPNISNLTLFNTCLDEDPMPVLEKLPNLVHLKLRNAYTGLEMVISPEGLQVLKFFYIGELWHLRDIKVGEGAMPMLKVLEISHCPYLEKLPKEVFTKLSELRMLTSKSIATKVHRDEKVTISKLRHVDIKP